MTLERSGTSHDISQRQGMLFLLVELPQIAWTTIPISSVSNTTRVYISFIFKDQSNGCSCGVEFYYGNVYPDNSLLQKPFYLPTGIISRFIMDVAGLSFEQHYV